jgi:hypothetical protein
LKSASWFFTLFLGATLYSACSQLPSPEESSSSLSSHVSMRYTQQSKTETGIQSPVGAVLADYRGFDLLAAGSLFFAALLFLFLFFAKPSGIKTFFPIFLGVGGLALALGVGFLSILQGSNFLDYEALASWVYSPRARLDGALILTGGVLLGSGGFLLMAIQWIQSKEGLSER